MCINCGAEVVNFTLSEGGQKRNSSDAFYRGKRQQRPMSVLPFTDREMQRAWRINLQASKHTSRSNAHRLLLFYSIECGLKAVLMKRMAVNCTSLCSEIADAQHNINKLLDYLSAGQSLKLPTQLEMPPIKIRGVDTGRKLDAGKVNQAWRYGGRLTQFSASTSKSIEIEDELIEKHLMQISEWIQKELNS